MENGAFPKSRCHLICTIGFWLLSHLPVGLAQQPVLQKREVKTPVIAIAIDHADQRVFYSSGNSIHVVDFELEDVATISTKMDFVHDCSLQGEHLFVGGGNPAENGKVELYSLENLERLLEVECHSDVIHSITPLNDGFVTGSADSTCRVYSNGSFVVKFKEHSKKVTSAVSISGSKWVVSAGLDDTLRVWDHESGELIRTMNHHRDDVVGLAMSESQDRPILASISTDKTVRFWQPDIGRMVRFQSLQDTPMACCWKPGSTFLYVGTDEGDVLEIDSRTLETTKLAGLKSHVHSISVLDESRLVVGTKTAIAVIAIQN